MYDLLILYNPYYQQDVISSHVKVLQAEGKVAFGKVRSKLNTQENNHVCEELYEKVSEECSLQLFLSDYANLYVAKVVAVTSSLNDCPIPSYYEQKSLDVDAYFIITDLLELVRNDFTTIRDRFLSNFTTPHHGGHSYAIYGNKYEYPLFIEQKIKEIYFDDDCKHYLDIYKNESYKDMQKTLMRFVFGERLFYVLHPNSVANLVSAELELMQNEKDPLYDFTSVVVKYSKVLEREIYDFTRKLIMCASKQDARIIDIAYNVQGVAYTVRDFFYKKPSLGTIRYLLRHEMITQKIKSEHVAFIQQELISHIELLQYIRNDAVHARQPHVHRVHKLRNQIIGIEGSSILKSLLLQKETIYEKNNKEA